VIAVPRENIPADAYTTHGADEFNHEVAVFADVPVKGAKIVGPE